MAEGLLEHLSHHGIQARSAGSHPKALHPNAVRVMADRGIDISGHATKHLRRFAGMRFDAEINLTNRGNMLFPMLLGRSALRGRFIVDPGRSYVCGRRRPRIRSENV